MRQLLFRNMTSGDRKKRDISVRESVAKNGILATSERRCLYFIKEKINISNTTDFVKLARIKKESRKGNRRFHVLKIHDSKTGTDKLICKLKGTFYAVIGRVVYCIVFIHSFKIKFKTLVMK